MRRTAAIGLGAPLVLALLWGGLWAWGRWRMAATEAAFEPRVRGIERSAVEIECVVGRFRARAQAAFPVGIETNPILPGTGRGAAGRRPGVEGHGRS